MEAGYCPTATAEAVYCKNITAPVTYHPSLTAPTAHHTNATAEAAYRPNLTAIFSRMDSITNGTTLVADQANVTAETFFLPNVTAFSLQINGSPFQMSPRSLYFTILYVFSKMGTVLTPGKNTSSVVGRRIISFQMFFPVLTCLVGALK